MLSAIQGFCLDEAANAPVLLDLISLPAGPARLCHSPEATNAHPTAVPDLPPRDKAQSPSGEEEEGGLLPPCCSALLVASRASPSAGAVASVLQWCGHPCAPPCWWRAPCTAPQKGRVRRMLPPAKSPSDSCLASFGRGAAHCPYSSIFPAAVRLASMYKLYLSLSVCHRRILSKEGRSLQAAPKLGYNSKQIQ